MVEQIVNEDSNLIKRLKDLENNSTVLISSDNEEKRKKQFLEDIKKITSNVGKNNSGNYYVIFLKDSKLINVYFRRHLYDTDFKNIQGIPQIDFWYRYNAVKISKSFEDMAKNRFSNEDNRYILNFKKEKNKKIIKEEIDETEEIKEDKYINIIENEWDFTVRLKQIDEIVKYYKIIENLIYKKEENNILILSKNKNRSKKILEDIVSSFPCYSNEYKEIIKYKDDKISYYIIRKYYLKKENKIYVNNLDDDLKIKFFISDKYEDLYFDILIIDSDEDLIYFNKDEDLNKKQIEKISFNEEFGKKVINSLKKLKCRKIGNYMFTLNYGNLSFKDIFNISENISDNTKEQCKIIKETKLKELKLNIGNIEDEELFLKRLIKELSEGMFKIYFIKKYYDEVKKLYYFKIFNDTDKQFEDLKIYLGDKNKWDYDYCFFTDMLNLRNNFN